MSLVAAPSSLLRSDADTIMLPTATPPSPPTTLARPVALELTVPVEFLAGGEFDAGGVHGHAHQRQQHEGQDVGQLDGERRPVNQGQVGQA